MLSILIKRIRTSIKAENVHGPKENQTTTKSLVTVEDTSESRMHAHNAHQQKVYLEQSRKLPPKSSKNVP